MYSSALLRKSFLTLSEQARVPVAPYYCTLYFSSIEEKLKTCDATFIYMVSILVCPALVHRQRPKDVFNCSKCLSREGRSVYAE
jgi:hypothetical protein